MGAGAVPEQPGQDGADRPTLGQDARDVERDGRDRQPSRLRELPDRVRAQSGRHEDEQHAGDGEEAAQVDAHAHREHRPADADRDDEARDGADHGAGDVARGAQDGEHEQHRLQAFADDRHEREPDERPRGPLVERGRDAGLQVTLDLPALGAHPEQHPGEHRHRDERGQPFERRLDHERQPPDGGHHDHPDGERQAQGRGHAQGDQAERIAPADLHQVRRDDAHDERGLQALAQGDEERGRHANSPSPTNPSGVATPGNAKK